MKKFKVFSYKSCEQCQGLNKNCQECYDRSVYDYQEYCDHITEDSREYFENKEGENG